SPPRHLPHAGRRSRGQLAVGLAGPRSRRPPWPARPLPGNAVLPPLARPRALPLRPSRTWTRPSQGKTTRVGSVTLSETSPFPTCPEEFIPQQRAVPSASTAQVVSRATEKSTTSERTGTGTS